MLNVEGRSRGPETWEGQGLAPLCPASTLLCCGSVRGHPVTDWLPALTLACPCPPPTPGPWGLTLACPSPPPTPEPRALTLACSWRTLGLTVRSGREGGRREGVWGQA